MTTIPWYYVWSPKYEAFHHLLMNCVSDCSGFVMRPQWFPQSAFTRNPTSTHFFAGNSLKFRRILEKMAGEIDENATFLLTDADLLVLDASRLFSLCSTFDAELVCMIDNLGSEDYNIGLMCCKNTARLRAYFQKLADTIDATGGQDQALLNQTLPESGLVHTTFSLKDAIQSNMRGEVQKNTFCVLQMLCSNASYEQNIFEKLLTAVHYFDITPLLEFVPPLVREALILFCRDHLPSNPLAYLGLGNAEEKGGNL